MCRSIWHNIVLMNTLNSNPGQLLASCQCHPHCREGGGGKSSQPFPGFPCLSPNAHAHTVPSVGWVGLAVERVVISGKWEEKLEFGPSLGPRRASPHYRKWVHIIRTHNNNPGPVVKLDYLDGSQCTCEGSAAQRPCEAPTRVLSQGHGGQAGALKPSLSRPMSEEWC